MNVDEVISAAAQVTRRFDICSGLLEILNLPMMILGLYLQKKQNKTQTHTLHNNLLYFANLGTNSSNNFVPRLHTKDD